MSLLRLLAPSLQGSDAFWQFERDGKVVSVKLYAIRDWDGLYENNRSRTVKDLAWVAIPNRHDGECYSSIITHEKGAKIFSAWILMVQVASRCQPRGTLLRDNKKPHTSLSLSMKTRAPQDWFIIAFDYLEKFTDWLVVKEVTSECQETDTVLPAKCQDGDEEQKGTEKNGKEGTEKNELAYANDARILLHHLNELSGRNFREVSSSLNPIIQRLSEPDVTLGGCKTMLKRQCEMWKGTAQAEYLRPSTLFGKEKFNGYYAGKDCPIIKNSINGSNHSQNHVRPNHDKGF